MKKKLDYLLCVALVLSAAIVVAYLRSEQWHSEGCLESMTSMTACFPEEESWPK